ncbi:cell division protein FtsL [Wolbachia endosymbiont (group A) of Barypeithes pellucidus]|uniref:cell division protein FtsL n=1 Tax=Wolbachia endosymbiont (group A) of Barypeithes pellucidus TaxID=3139322 RepID=UPI003CCAED31
MFFLSIVGLFKVKLYVQSLNRELIKIKSEINLVQSDIKVLQAEWSYLNNPKRLASLVKKYLKNNSLILASQVKNLDSLNGRSVLAQLKTQS